MPPFWWLAGNWYLKLWTLDETIQISLSPVLLVYVAGYVTMSYVFLTNHFKIIEIYKIERSNLNLDKAQHAAASLPKSFLFLIGLYCIIGPNTGMWGKEFLTSPEYIMGELLGIPIIFLFSLPLFIVLTKKWEQFCDFVPVSENCVALQLRGKIFFSAYLSFVGGILVMLICAYSCFYTADSLEQGLSFLLKKGVIFSLLVCAVAAFDILLLSQQIGYATRNGLGKLKAVSNGELNIQPDISTRDEWGYLLVSLNKMIENLSSFAIDVQKAAEKVALGSEQMKANAGQISQGTSQQAANVEEISSSMEEMSSTVNLNAENAQQTASIAMEAARGAREGGKTVNKTVQAMNVISDKIRIIEDIARETDMLALNASIEAARAGEYGMGFAVVASEIGKLSKRCQEAAKEISALSISNISLAQETGRQLENMIAGIQKTAELVQEISISCNEQADGISQVNMAIQQLDDVIQDNVASTEEMAASGHEFAGQAERLLKTASFFKISEIVKQKFEEQSEALSDRKAQKLKELFEKFVAAEKQNVMDILNKKDSSEKITGEKESISIEMEEVKDKDFESY
ncbi:Methyl-accepting chemotaxis protein signailling domain-containing protein [Desulfonema magnum]|uniref:Methyl-accepting chemotaxis protein signailling domain-containing protein n=2 Tax=Desulfonema magnum TaxID=45655 RepID=A0A975GSF5_9BACT|nr:Methyl-accepting chemotaxis protein signailling domain-containing protein [Desulfonema magnum]